jgi:hypothetical protein
VTDAEPQAGGRLVTVLGVLFALTACATAPLDPRPECRAPHGQLVLFYSSDCPRGIDPLECALIPEITVADRASCHREDEIEEQLDDRGL